MATLRRWDAADLERIFQLQDDNKTSRVYLYLFNPELSMCFIVPELRREAAQLE